MYGLTSDRARGRRPQLEANPNSRNSKTARQQRLSSCSRAADPSGRRSCSLRCHLAGASWPMASSQCVLRWRTSSQQAAIRAMVLARDRLTVARAPRARAGLKCGINHAKGTPGKHLLGRCASVKVVHVVACRRVKLTHMPGHIKGQTGRETSLAAHSLAAHPRAAHSVAFVLAFVRL